MFFQNLYVLRPILPKKVTHFSNDKNHVLFYNLKNFIGVDNDCCNQESQAEIIMPKTLPI